MITTTIFVNVEFERGILQLAALTGHAVDALAAAFNRWCESKPLPWRVALDYCIDRARAGKSLPFTIERESGGQQR